jgi:hypothetical protein
VFGVYLAGGGLGGGGVLGHLADGLDPLWPAAIRERLPRWWVDQTLRRQQALSETANATASLFDAQMTRTTALMETYNTSPENLRPALAQAFEAACIKDMELGSKHYQTLAELRPMTRGNNMREIKEIQSNVAFLLADRARQRVVLTGQRALALTDRTDNLLDQLDLLPAEALSERLRILEHIRKLRLVIMRDFDAIDAHMRDLNLWYSRITDKPNKTVLSRAFVDLNARLNEANQLYLKTGQLLEIVKRYDTTSDISWFYLQARAQTLRTKVDRALFTQYSLQEASATRAQRNQILQECLDLYGEFRRNMNAWTASYPQHFHLDAVGPLLQGIEKMADRARKAIDQPAPVSPAGQRHKKVFTTEDDQLLIGEERWEPTTQKRQYTLTGQRGFEEVWEQGTNGKFRLLNPQEQRSHPAHRDLGALTADARSRLAAQAAYKTRVEAYARQDMLPVDLEHMMLSEAAELGRRALTIEALQPGHTLIQQLRDKATELTHTGRVLRIEYSMKSRNPTDGMLDYLMKQNSSEQKILDIHKSKPLEKLAKRADGRTDYLQEYEVRDLTQTPPKVMWYAHFHYAKAAPVFAEFEKAHLKLPEHRFLTHADNADFPYADIGKQSAALKYFEPV